MFGLLTVALTQSLQQLGPILGRCHANPGLAGRDGAIHGSFAYPQMEAANDRAVDDRFLILNNVDFGSHIHKENLMTASRAIFRLLGGPLVCLAMLPATGCQGMGLLGPDQTNSSMSDDVGLVLSSSRDPQPVPFKGTLAASERVVLNPPPSGCELSIRDAEAGELAHLGSFTGTLTLCAFNGQFVVTDPPFNLGGGPPPYFVTDFTVEATYTAANGDLLQVSGTGVLVQSLIDRSSGLIGDGVIDGGTGRFAAARGEFDVLGANEEVSYDGWIVYDASSRSDH